jgi:hypothetical protein
LANLGLKNRYAVDSAWAAVKSAEEQFRATAEANTGLRNQLATAKITVTAKDIAYDEIVAKTDQKCTSWGDSLA